MSEMNPWLKATLIVLLLPFSVLFLLLAALGAGGNKRSAS